MGFRSLFGRLFISVFLALVVFAAAMFAWIQVVYNNSDTIKQRSVAHQIAAQIDPLLLEIDKQAKLGNRVQARFGLVIIKKSFDIFDESLQAKIGLYDASGKLILQTDNSLLPKTVQERSRLYEMMPTLWGDAPGHVQVKTSSGFSVWYESRDPPAPKRWAGFFNLFTGTALLLGIMSGVLWLIAKNITRRLSAMGKQMALLGEGDFSVRVSEQGNDEIALLARGFNQAAAKIEKLIDANNLLLAHASHEFRTPITRMRLQTEMLAMLGDALDDKNKTQVHRRTDAINRDLNGLNDLIESILLVSRLDAGHAAGQAVDVDLYELAASECQHYSDATLRGHSVHLLAQPNLLVHLIRNLINNAFVHGKAPVFVYVYGCQSEEEARALPDFDDCSGDAKTARPNDDASLNPENKNDPSFFGRFKKPVGGAPKVAALAVVDHGEGIAKDKREAIFSPFVRLKQEKKGSGLGLSLVAQIVQAHGGRIVTDTWQGKTRFLVTLPTSAPIAANAKNQKNA